MTQQKRVKTDIVEIIIRIIQITAILFAGYIIIKVLSGI